MKYDIKKFMKDLNSFQIACDRKKLSKKRMAYYLEASNIKLGKRSDRRFISGCIEILLSKTYKKQLKPTTVPGESKLMRK